MTKNEIIKDMAKHKMVEVIIAKATNHNLREDLSQDIYIELLEKPDELIEGLFDRDELHKYVVGMVRNNVHSTTSRFFKNYIDYEKRTTQLRET